jgi:hypothetical protein
MIMYFRRIKRILLETDKRRFLTLIWNMATKFAYRDYGVDDERFPEPNWIGPRTVESPPAVRVATP